MKRYLTSALCVLTVLFSACSKDAITDDIVLTSNHKNNSKSEMIRSDRLDGVSVPGVLYVKMDPTTAERLQSSGSSIDLQTFSAVSSEIELAAKRVGVTHVERVFPEDKRFEKRHREYGLDRWYLVAYEENTGISTAMRTLSSLKQFEVVEPVYDIEMGDYTITRDLLPHVFDPTTSNSTAKLPFDDPRLSEQWHYNNNGTAPSSVPGADINLFEAWKIETGKPNVIVAVIDDGVDYKHEDLKDNMWTNPKSGLPIQHENYKEEEHGGNFVPLGVRGEHGTHVAGTIAARNGNGKGVCGVAGGDETPGTGVRIMACLAIDNRPKDQRKGSHPERAFVFAADNGAVIAQNSWGYPPNVEMGQILKDAIDYFIDNAGTDANGNQRADSPMKGGVVIFAAGNDNTDAPCYPAAYDRVIAVAAMGPNFIRSSFTNRGPWVDLIAPGGDIEMYGVKAGILSCLPDNGYGFYQGTSMACPHVSGIAALIASKNGGSGYTNKMLKKSLLSALRNQDVDKYNPREAGRLGRGYVDAGRAFGTDLGIAPDAPILGSQLSSDYTSIDFSWVVSKDGDDQLPTFEDLYISDRPITASRLKTLNPIRMRVSVETAGEEMDFRFTGLTHSTKYYIAVVSEDRWGNRSEPGLFEYSTRTNQSPLIQMNNLPKEIIVSGQKSVTLDFMAEDPDGHKVSCSIEGETKGVTELFANGKGKITIRPVLSEGTYLFNLIAKDEFGAMTKKQITFQVIDQKPLRLIGEFSQVIIGEKQEDFILPLKNNIDYNRKLKIKFEAHSADPSIAITSLYGDGLLSIIPVKSGIATIYVKAKDESGSEINISFKVRVVKDEKSPVHIVYPIPVKTNLNIIFNKSITDPRVKILTMSGRVIIDQAIKFISKDGSASINVNNLAPNSYRLIVESANMPRYEQVFVK